MKKHWFWITEVFIWLAILFLISSIMIFGIYHYRKSFNTYQIFLPDVDGLINGSPVKLMGIQVGYVNQLDIVGEDVYVKFIITRPKVKLPYGSVATVEFSGLGGSKSLELYPPEQKSATTSKFIIVQRPKRIHDSAGLLNDMFKDVANLAYTVSTFMDKLGMIRGQKCYNTIDAPTVNKILKDSNNWLDKAQEHCQKFGDTLSKKNGKRSGNGNKHDSNKSN